MVLKKEYKRILANKNVLIYALILGIVFLFSEVLARIHDWYRTFPSIDIVTHFFSGAAFGMFIYWAITVRKREERVYLALVYMFFIGIIWELIEILEERIYGEVFPHLQDSFIWDGFGDIIMNLVGASFAMIIFKCMKRRVDWFNYTEL